MPFQDVAVPAVSPLVGTLPRRRWQGWITTEHTPQSPQRYRMEQPRSFPQRRLHPLASFAKRTSSGNDREAVAFGPTSAPALPTASLKAGYTVPSALRVLTKDARRTERQVLPEP